MSLTAVEAGPCPHLRVGNVLDPETRGALVECITTQAQSLPDVVGVAEGRWPGPKESTLLLDVDRAWCSLDAWICSFAAVIRRELGVDHFHLEEIEHWVTVHDEAGVRHAQHHAATEARRRVWASSTRCRTARRRSPEAHCDCSIAWPRED